MIRRVMVVLPEPVPPQMPMISGRPSVVGSRAREMVCSWARRFSLLSNPALSALSASPSYPQLRPAPQPIAQSPRGMGRR
jgi:hypothetical protein